MSTLVTCRVLVAVCTWRGSGWGWWHC